LLSIPSRTAGSCPLRVKSGRSLKRG